MNKTLIAAVGRNNAIGIWDPATNTGIIPWPRISADMKAFRLATTDNVCIVGYNTFLTLGSKPLPKRTFILVTSKNIPESEYLLVAKDVPSAMACATLLMSSVDVFFIGGQRIYEEGMQWANRLLITEVAVDVPNANVFFPKIDPLIWKEVSRVKGEPSGDPDEPEFWFVVYERIYTKRLVQ